MLGGLRSPKHPHWRFRSQAMDAFELNPPTQLVLGFGFLNQVTRPVHYNCRIQNRPYIRNYKSHKNSRTEKSVSDHCASFETAFFFNIFGREKDLKILIKIDYNSKNIKLEN